MRGSGEASNESSVLRAYLAERDTAWVRFAVIFFNIPLYLWALPHFPGRHGLALVVAGIAMAYAVTIVAARPYERFPVLRTAWYTLVTDSLLITVWLYATGGIHSPFYPLWPLSLLAVTFRFGPRVVGAATVIYAMADVGMLAVSGDLAGNVPVVATRVAYIVLVGVVGVLLGHRWSQAVSARVDMAQDMARKEHLLREADRLRVLTDAAFEGIIIHRKGRILEINRAATDLFARPRAELIGSHVADVVAEESREVMQERLLYPQDTRFELWIHRPDGERRRIAVQARHMTYQGEPARVTAVRDITDEYEAQQAREMAAAQRAEIDRLQELDRFKTRFFNTAAHELNTPLTPIKLQLHLLRDEFPEKPHSLDMLERNLDRLGRLIADMLDISRLHGGRLKVRARTVDLAAVAEEVMETFAPAALENHIRTERLLPPRLVSYADPERVVQILSNLLSNALKFTPEGGHVTVVGRETGQGVRIEVIDSGRGVPPEDQDKLFQPFSQIHEDPSIPGTGLGLYICKNLAETMGGRIGCDSDGHGSRFWFELPRDPPEASPTDATAPGPQDEERAAPPGQRRHGRSTPDRPSGGAAAERAAPGSGKNQPFARR